MTLYSVRLKIDNMSAMLVPNSMDRNTRGIERNKIAIDRNTTLQAFGTFDRFKS